MFKGQPSTSDGADPYLLVYHCLNNTGSYAIGISSKNGIRSFSLASSHTHIRSHSHSLSRTALTCTRSYTPHCASRAASAPTWSTRRCQSYLCRGEGRGQRGGSNSTNPTGENAKEVGFAGSDGGVTGRAAYLLTLHIISKKFLTLPPTIGVPRPQVPRVPDAHRANQRGTGQGGQAGQRRRHKAKYAHCTTVCGGGGGSAGRAVVRVMHRRCQGTTTVLPRRTLTRPQ